MLLQWGIELADLLHIPAYIEASKEGNLLYKTFGFYDAFVLDELEEMGDDGVQIMQRDVRRVPIVGGKAKAAS